MKTNKIVNKVINIIIRLIFIACGLILIALYIGPVIAGVLNLGNAFGLGVAAILILSAVFLTPIINFIKKLWQSNSGKGIIIAVTAIILIGITIFTSTLVSIISYSQYTAKNETTVIVLGCRIWGSTPSRALKARANAAAEYLKTHPDAVAILSGGQGPDENLSEAQCMHNIITETGIDASRLYLEDQSTSTDENIAFSKKIIEEKGLSKNVAIATTDYHQKRAAMICEKNGLKSASLPSVSGKSTKSTFFTREVFGVIVQWLMMLKN